MTDHLFSPITLGGLEVPNRIAVAPMCQYSADDGSASDWHLQQWMMYALSGAGMVTMEMTLAQLVKAGRISLADASERAANEDDLRRLMAG